MSGDLVILSGGLDSTVCLALASREARRRTEREGRGPVVAVTFDYGQRHSIELDRAALIAEHFGVEHLVVRIDSTGWAGSALIDPGIEIPDATSADGTAAGDPIPVTYVPARNLVFLSMAMAIAEARDLDAVHLGVNALDYSGYPDCRPAFVASFQATAALALKRGVEGRPIEVAAPLVHLGKAQIVLMGLGADAPLHLTWSCYRGNDVPCGTCDACVLRAKGFAEAGIEDPALASPA